MKDLIVLTLLTLTIGLLLAGLFHPGAIFWAFIFGIGFVSACVRCDIEENKNI